MSNDLEINKGVELMLRRDKKEPEPKGFRLSKTLSFLKRTFNFKLEITWGGK
jgi:hypothetical protein